MAKYRKVLPGDKDGVVNLFCDEGMSMGQISKMTDISKTKISVILHEANSPDNAIFLRHNLAVNLRKAGITMTEYAGLTRAQNILARQGIQPAKVLATVREVTEQCFRINLEPQTLATSFKNFRQFVSSIPNMSPEKLERTLTELKYLQTIVNDLDAVLDNCRKLISAIDRLERLASLSSNPVGKH